MHVDGESVKSCTVLAAQADGSAITTLEGLADPDGVAAPDAGRVPGRARAAVRRSARPGMVMAAVGLLDENPHPTETEIREGLEGNICRCTGYHNIVRAVRTAARGIAL